MFLVLHHEPISKGDFVLRGPCSLHLRAESSREDYTQALPATPGWLTQRRILQQPGHAQDDCGQHVVLHTQRLSDALRGSGTQKGSQTDSTLILMSLGKRHPGNKDILNA